jgi:hypothetical protein
VIYVVKKVRETVREFRRLFASVSVSFRKFPATNSAAFSREVQNSAASAAGFLNRWPGVRVTPGALSQNAVKFPDFPRRRPGISPGSRPQIRWPGSGPDTPLPRRILGTIALGIGRFLERIESRSWT